MGKFLRAVFKLIFKLVAAALVLFLLTAVGIVLDGLSDAGQKADAALVIGHAQVVPGMPNPPLDRVVQLYNEQEIPLIIVSGPIFRMTTEVFAGQLRLTGSSTDDEAADMAKYLESHGIPSSAIIQDHDGETTLETADNMAEIMEMAHHVAEIMKAHQLESVMIVTEYYHMTLTQLTLMHEGITGIQKAHVGKPDKADAWKIGREVVAFYEYVGKTYLLPAAEKARQEAQTGIDKAQTDAEKAKAKVDKSLDNMAK